MRPRHASIIARLAQLALDTFACGSSASEFRPIDKISTLVSNAASLVLPQSEDSSQIVEGSVDLDPGLQELFDLMGDSGLEWPSTLVDETSNSVNTWDF